MRRIRVMKGGNTGRQRQKQKMINEEKKDTLVKTFNTRKSTLFLAWSSVSDMVPTRRMRRGILLDSRPEHRRVSVGLLDVKPP